MAMAHWTATGTCHEADADEDNCADEPSMRSVISGTSNLLCHEQGLRLPCRQSCCGIPILHPPSQRLHWGLGWGGMLERSTSGSMAKHAEWLSNGPSSPPSLPHSTCFGCGLSNLHVATLPLTCTSHVYPPMARFSKPLIPALLCMLSHWIQGSAFAFPHLPSTPL